MFTYRAFTLPKDVEHPDEFQDAWRCDSQRGVAAVADGVSSALFSGPWADVLVEAVVAQPPPLDDAAAMAAWLAVRRQAWQAKIDVTGLAWFQKAKLPAGAFSTLLWVCLEGDGAEFSWRGHAVGDSCLFHVREGRLLCVFPIEKAADFAADPVAWGSLDLARDHLVRFASAQGKCQRGDLLLLATDAVAQWLLAQVEAGNPPVWADFLTMTDDEWRGGLERLRAQNLMRYDDATLLLLEVGVPADAVAKKASSVDASASDAPEAPVEPIVVVAEEDAAAPILLPDDSIADKLKKTGDELAQGIEEAAEQVSTGLDRLKHGFVRFYRSYVRPDQRED
jgi:hypothetical protein